MPASYIPQKQSLYDAWMLNFTTLLTANAALYGQTAGVAAGCAAAYATWHAAYLLTTSSSTKTKSTVAAKDAAKAACSLVVRPVAMAIRNNLGVSNSDKSNLGLTIVDQTPTPVPPPATSPMLDVLGATPLQHTIRFHDQNTPTSRAKPAGVFFGELHAAVSATVVSDPNTLPVNQYVTKQPIAVTWQQADVGKTAYYAMRWVNRRGQVGPWSPIATFTVANG